MALALVLSWSLVGPIQRTETRLAEIAGGDFSRHVEVPNRDELGSLAANLNRMNDELRGLYEELETVSRHKSEFLANMSHELRTPLNAIIGFSELLQLESFGPLNEQQRVYVEDVLEAGQHLLLLINDILDLAKVEAGRMDLELSDVSLGEVLETGVTMHVDRAARSGIEIAVADTGPGIAPEDQGLIFEEFGQANLNGGGRRHEGTGLGLPLSRRFVELHGGRLWVESVPGMGSTFRFTLPLVSVGSTR
jgi:signal transduction histidine kinase